MLQEHHKKSNKKCRDQ